MKICNQCEMTNEDSQNVCIHCGNSILKSKTYTKHELKTIYKQQQKAAKVKKKRKQLIIYFSLLVSYLIILFLSLYTIDFHIRRVFDYEILFSIFAFLCGSLFYLLIDLGEKNTHLTLLAYEMRMKFAYIWLFLLSFIFLFLLMI